MPEKRIDRRNTRWEEHRQERRRQLVDAAVSAVEKYGFDASMDQIAEEAGTSKSILYKYFGDKEGLQYAIGDHVAEQLYEEFDSAVRRGAMFDEILDQVIGRFLQIVEETPDLYRFMSIAELEDDPEAIGTGLINRPLVEAWARLFYVDERVSQHEHHEGIVYAWLTAMINMIKGVVRAWLAIREIAENPEDSPRAELSSAQRDFGAIDRKTLQHLFTGTIAHVAEEIVAVSYGILANEEVTPEKRAEINEHVRSFSPAYSEFLRGGGGGFTAPTQWRRARLKYEKTRPGVVVMFYSGLRLAPMPAAVSVM